MARTDRVAHDAASIKIVRKRDGSLGWRVRDGNGVALKPSFGAHVAPDPERDGAAYRASVQAIQRVLKRELALKRRAASKETVKVARIAKLRKPTARIHELRKPD